MLNGLLRQLGTGVFHCGVEVFGDEWSYSDTMSGAGDGIFCSVPRFCDGHSYTESLTMGRTRVSEVEFQRLLKALKKEWTVSSYDILTQNCCHFSEHLCRRLGVGNIPDWIKNLASTGAAIVETGDASLQVAKQVAKTMAGTTAHTMCCSPSSGTDVVEIVEVCKYSGAEDDDMSPRKVARKTISHLYLSGGHGEAMSSPAYAFAQVSPESAFGAP
eukprot:CAMPEP_0197917466 /NCGR_PEP_ID=MMETSP1439-20131203/83880_1 /TAXON_ID=66791 /ORGANISM="Gonyaulax spinifera, Strain CCMP409" /LENGTH=215 /DNA_ID=CAMNT_0043539543 /DNA_START=1 /DNA_END=645 /DNA_ORIENTATION=-